jgi:YTH domain-containing family protein
LQCLILVCCFSGYDGSANEWDSRYAGHEGMEMPPVS